MAFSHYTYSKSNRQLQIVDLQGINYILTDPQIHTAEINNIGLIGPEDDFKHSNFAGGTGNKDLKISFHLTNVILSVKLSIYFLSIN